MHMLKMHKDTEKQQPWYLFASHGHRLDLLVSQLKLGSIFVQFAVDYYIPLLYLLEGATSPVHLSVLPSFLLHPSTTPFPTPCHDSPSPGLTQ